MISGEGQHLYVVTRMDEPKVISRSTSQRGQRPAYTYMSLAPEVKGRHMEPLIVDLEILSDEERSVHEGEEFIHVLQGTVVLEIGDDHFELTPGDSAYYLSTTPHLIAAKADKAKNPGGGLQFNESGKNRYIFRLDRSAHLRVAKRAICLRPSQASFPRYEI